MAQTWNPQGYDYVAPPPLIMALVRGRTWEKFCEPCGRIIVIDLLRVLEHHDPHDRDIDTDRWRCKDCGGKLRGHSGLIISSVRHIGRWPKDKTIVMPEWEKVPAF